MIEFKLYGNWNRIERALAGVPLAVAQSAMWGQRKAAEQLIKIVKGHINNQDLGWAARSETTNSGDARILVDYGEYYSNIKAWREAGVYFVGVKRSAKNNDGLSISLLASYHEYGTEHEPARPLWGPSKKEMGGSAGVRKIIIATIYSKISRLKHEGLDISLGL